MYSCPQSLFNINKNLMLLLNKPPSDPRCPALIQPYRLDTVEDSVISGTKFLTSLFYNNLNSNCSFGCNLCGIFSNILCLVNRAEHACSLCSSDGATAITHVSPQIELILSVCSLHVQGHKNINKPLRMFGTFSTYICG